MTRTGCSRVFQVEAARDGRLSGTALDAYERHFAGCVHCKQEHEELEAIACALRGQPLARQDELALRRAREALLADATPLLHSRDEPSSRRRWPYVVAVAAAIALLVAGVRATRGPKAMAVVTEPEGRATWTRHRGRDIERIELSDGVLRVSVERTPSDPRLIVRVPEGEIEDLGTVFEVSVRNHHTIEVGVTRGVVLFRRSGQADLRLSAGTVWSASADHSPPVAAPASATAVEARAPAPSASRIAARKAPSRSAARARVSRAGVAPRGAAATADAQPNTAEEDAAYLRILALLREGRREEARLAAASYLSKFSKGFRRAEVERIAWPTESQ